MKNTQQQLVIDDINYCDKVLSWVRKRKDTLAVRKSIKESGEMPWIRFKDLSDNVMS